MKQSKVIFSLLVASIVTAGLAGCASVYELDVFSRDQVAGDELPADGDPNVIDAVDASSTRLLLQNDDGSFYAAKGSGDQSDATCLVIFMDGEGSSSCSTGPIEVRRGGGPAYLLGNLPSGSDRWTKVAEHLYVDNSE